MGNSQMEQYIQQETQKQQMQVNGVRFMPCHLHKNSPLISIMKKFFTLPGVADAWMAPV